MINENVLDFTLLQQWMQNTAVLITSDDLMDKSIKRSDIELVLNYLKKEGILSRYFTTTGCLSIII